MKRSWIGGWRGSLLAAAISVLCALPGLIALPTVDRNEAVFAQGTAQMLDEHNPTDIRFQERVRPGSMPGAHWLQAASVTVVSEAEARAIWAYRLPSLLGVVVLVVATVRGGGRLFGPRAGFVSGLVLATSALGATLSDLATADALFAGAAAVMLAAFGYLYAAHREGVRLRRRDKVIFWAALIAAVMLKGPLILGLAGLAGIALVVMDRQIKWLNQLGLTWGLIALGAVAGPWLMAVTVSTDGQFWQGAPSLVRGGLGLQTAILPLLLFPAGLLLPFAAGHAWREQASPGVRLAIAWLAPAWIALEMLPGLQLHGASSLYIAVVWLGCAGLLSGRAGPAVRLTAAAVSLICAGVVATAAFQLAWRFGDGNDWPAAGLAMVLAAGAGLAGARAAWRPDRVAAQILTLAAGGLTTALLLGAVLPGAQALWPTRNLLRGLEIAGLDPRGGLARGPVASSGYEEPSLVFNLGSDTQLGDAAVAVAALADNRPAIVAEDQKAAALQLLAARGRTADVVYHFQGYDPAEATSVSLYILKSAP